MFFKQRPINVTVHQPPRDVMSVTETINHHHAPTDESVRLLREMEAEAQAAIINRLRLKGSLIDCVVHCEQMAFDNTYRWRAVVDVNGTKLKAEVDVEYITSDKVLADTYERLLNELAVVIATSVLREPFQRLIVENKLAVGR